MNHSETCTNLVKSMEGCSFTAYQDGNGVWTLGFGHTEGVRKGDTCTLDEAIAWLNHDLETADEAVGRLVMVPLTQNQYDALVSLCYNIGQGNFGSSTCRRLLNAGDYAGASDAILMWNKIAHQISPGLVRRRLAEQKLFLEA